MQFCQLYASNRQILIYGINFPCLFAEHRQKLYVEMACNGLFGGGDNGQINPPNVNKHFKLVTAKLVTIDRDVTALIRDLEILIDIVKVSVVYWISLNYSRQSLGKLTGLR